MPPCVAATTFAPVTPGYCIAQTFRPHLKSHCLPASLNFAFWMLTVPTGSDFLPCDS